MNSGEKVNIEHPIVHLEDKVKFLKTLRETLVVSTNKARSIKERNISKTEEQLEQYEKAIEILRKYHDETV